MAENDRNLQIIAQTWKTITTDIPQLQEYCSEILRAEGYEESIGGPVPRQ